MGFMLSMPLYFCPVEVQYCIAVERPTRAINSPMTLIRFMFFCQHHFDMGYLATLQFARCSATFVDVNQVFVQNSCQRT